MNNENMAVYPPYRLVAQFSDGARLLFDGLTEAQAQQSMEAAQSLQPAALNRHKAAHNVMRRYALHGKFVCPRFSCVKCIHCVGSV